MIYYYIFVAYIVSKILMKSLLLLTLILHGKGSPLHTEKYIPLCKSPYKGYFYGSSWIIKIINYNISYTSLFSLDPLYTKAWDVVLDPQDIEEVEKYKDHEYIVFQNTDGVSFVNIKEKQHSIRENVYKEKVSNTRQFIGKVTV